MDEEKRALDREFKRMNKEKRAHDREFKQMNEEKRAHDRELERLMKSVTIRGVESKIYDDFSYAMKMLDLNMGDALTKMMNDVMKDFDDTFPTLSAKGTFGKIRMERAVIQHHSSLSINKKDLEEANARFIIQHVDNLKIEPDVTKEVFLKYIRLIQHCGVVRLPSILPKLTLYSKINFCDRIELYDVAVSETEITSKNEDNESSSEEYYEEEDEYYKD